MKKNFSKTGKKCRVTFELETESSSVALCGEFNNWDPEAHPMTKRKDGVYSVTISLDTGRSYRFRYMLADGNWENDWNADSYLPNDFGSEDSVLDL